jgi:hypothetical protein
MPGVAIWTWETTCLVCGKALYVYTDNKQMYRVCYMVWYSNCLWYIEVLDVYTDNMHNYQVYTDNIQMYRDLLYGVR